jgi:hypothetical protein
VASGTPFPAASPSVKATSNERSIRSLAPLPARTGGATRLDAETP